MPLFQIDPLQDPRWSALLERHPRASVYGSPGWLEALRGTYGYRPVVLTTSPPEAPLTNGLPVCHVKSWLTGNRLVSLPFSDHCQPLMDEGGEATDMLSFLGAEAIRGKWAYAEIRPLEEGLAAAAVANGFHTSQTFALHRLDLSPSLQELFARSHKSCVQRKVRRAEREGLEYEHGRSDLLLSKLHDLLRMTRKRHGLPPQPLAWFRNLLACMGNNLTIHVASKDGQPIAGILTLSFKKTLVYKYGGSDVRYHNLGGMPFLFWHAIQHAKRMGLEEFDLGRSDQEDAGLIEFKRHLGATASTLVYYRYSSSKVVQTSGAWKLGTAKRIFQNTPAPLLNVAGRLLYRHFG